eukprot:TRINITY_DN434_c0_g1_i1.p2 TRINITY_DN434_c0_g1~~TRINITY_DN434_c0_g1_i1.p2  ORF type:complete len:164 (-),score=57.20 TRINITY_DN434_c0_g1_i1:91-582(-)
MASAALLRSSLRFAAAPRRFAPSAVRFAAPAPLCGRFASTLRFAKSHEWLKAEDGTATLGISDFAQGQLGEVVFCDLPSEGATFKAKETICTLESVKAVGEVYAPVDCEVVEVNEGLGDEPALVNSSPMEEGWLVKVKYTGDLAELLDEAAYEKHVEAESEEN